MMNMKLLTALLAGLLIYSPITHADDNEESEKKETCVVAEKLSNFESLTQEPKTDAEYYYLINLSTIASKYDYKLRENDSTYKSEEYHRDFFKKNLKQVAQMTRSPKIEAIFLYTNGKRPEVLSNQLKHLKLNVPTYHTEQDDFRRTFKDCSSKGDSVYLYKSDGSLVRQGAEELILLWKPCTTEGVDEEELNKKLARAKSLIDKTIKRQETIRKRESAKSRIGDSPC